MGLNKIFSEALEWVKHIILIVTTALFISIFIFQPYAVSGNSMEPTFEQSGEKVIVFKAPYYLNIEPNYGDIVTVDSRVKRIRTLKDEFIESPLVTKLLGINNRHIWIKRVIGLPGDILEFKEGKIIRNGIILEEDYIKEEMVSSFDTVVVPENHVFVMGDNRNYSNDSRQTGPVPIENVQGKVLIRYFPLDKLTKY